MATYDSEADVWETDCPNKLEGAGVGALADAGPADASAEDVIAPVPAEPSVSPTEAKRSPLGRKKEVLVTSWSDDVKGMAEAALGDRFKVTFALLEEDTLKAALPTKHFHFLVWIFVGNPMLSVSTLLKVLGERHVAPKLVLIRLPTRDTTGRASDAVLLESAVMDTMLRLHAYEPDVMLLREEGSGMAEAARKLTLIDGGDKFRRNPLYRQVNETEFNRSTWCGSRRPKKVWKSLETCPEE